MTMAEALMSRACGRLRRYGTMPLRVTMEPALSAILRFDFLQNYVMDFAILEVWLPVDWVCRTDRPFHLAPGLLNGTFKCM